MYKRKGLEYNNNFRIGEKIYRNIRDFLCWLRCHRYTVYRECIPLFDPFPHRVMIQKILQAPP